MTEDHYLKKELSHAVETDPALFDFIMRSSLDGLWYWDLEKPEHEWMSEGFWELFGVDPSTKQHLASEWQHLIHPEDLERALDNFHKHANDPDHPYDQVVRYKHADGSTVYVRCRGLILRDETGKPTRMLGAHTDVTALKQAEEALAHANMQLQEQLAQANAAAVAKEEFLSMMSHEIRTPLNAIMGTFDLIADSTNEDRQRRRAENGLDAAARLLELLDNVLSSVRSGAKETRRESVETPMADIVRFADILVEGGLARAKTGVQGVIHRSATLPDSLCVDLSGVQQILSNLISNAIKFTESGRIVVSFDTAEVADIPALKITVRDTGHGIPSDKCEAVFQEFVQVHTGMTRSVGGSGLGLAISRQLAERMGGTLTLESQLGTGSIFTCTIPYDIETQDGRQEDAHAVG